VQLQPDVVNVATHKDKVHSTELSDDYN